MDRVAVHPRSGRALARAAALSARRRTPRWDARPRYLERVENGFRHHVRRRPRRPPAVHGAATRIREVVLREADAEAPRRICIAERATSAHVTERVRRRKRAG